MKAKPIYKIMDGKGRVLIPKELRTSSGMDYGYIVRLSIHQGIVTVKKVDLIEVGDQSPEAVEAFVHAAIVFCLEKSRFRRRRGCFPSKH